LRHYQQLEWYMVVLGAFFAVVVEAAAATAVAAAVAPTANGPAVAAESGDIRISSLSFEEHSGQQHRHCCSGSNIPAAAAASDAAVAWCNPWQQVLLPTHTHSRSSAQQSILVA
jgi:hypothetical protein